MILYTINLSPNVQDCIEVLGDITKVYLHSGRVWRRVSNFDAVSSGEFSFHPYVGSCTALIANFEIFRMIAMRGDFIFDLKILT